MPNLSACRHSLAASVCHNAATIQRHHSPRTRICKRPILISWFLMPWHDILVLQCELNVSPLQDASALHGGKSTAHAICASFRLVAFCSYSLSRVTLSVGYVGMLLSVTRLTEAVRDSISIYCSRYITKDRACSRYSWLQSPLDKRNRTRRSNSEGHSCSFKADCARTRNSGALTGSQPQQGSSCRNSITLCRRSLRPRHAARTKRKRSPEHNSQTSLKTSSWSSGIDRISSRAGFGGVTGSLPAAKVRASGHE